MKSATRVLTLNPFEFFATLFFNLSWQIFSKIFWCLLLSVFISFTVLIFFQINSLAKETNSIRILEQKLKMLSKENQDWQIRTAKVDHQVLTESLIKELNFEKAGTPHFIIVPDQKVARSNYENEKLAD